MSSFDGATATASFAEAAVGGLVAAFAVLAVALVVRPGAVLPQPDSVLFKRCRAGRAFKQVEMLLIYLPGSD
jgi:hypothetical protein